jgi:hypothetical protein
VFTNSKARKRWVVTAHYAFYFVFNTRRISQNEGKHKASLVVRSNMKESQVTSSLALAHLCTSTISYKGYLYRTFYIAIHWARHLNTAHLSPRWPQPWESDWDLLEATTLTEDRAQPQNQDGHTRAQSQCWAVRAIWNTLLDISHSLSVLSFLDHTN